MKMLRESFNGEKNETGLKAREKRQDVGGWERNRRGKKLSNQKKGGVKQKPWSSCRKKLKGHVGLGGLSFGVGGGGGGNTLLGVDGRSKKKKRLKINGNGKGKAPKPALTKELLMVKVELRGKLQTGTLAG